MDLAFAKTEDFYLNCSWGEQTIDVVQNATNLPEQLDLTCSLIIHYYVYVTIAK